MSTPIIITVPNSYILDDVDTKLALSPGAQPSRKRKLDHLSWEEKMQRKKLKNRVAAQTSRDRKKAKMDEMEHRIQHLEDVNERLIDEMTTLKALNERLAEENEALRSEVSAARTVPVAPRPAESCPQQKEGLPSAMRALRTLLALMLLSQNSSQALTQTSASTVSTSSLSPSSKKLLQLLQDRLKTSQNQGNLSEVLKQLKWWGPHQSTWNPVEVQ